MKPTIKPVKRKHPTGDKPDSDDEQEIETHTALQIQFKSEQGETKGSVIEIPKECTQKQLETLLNSILENDERTPYSFYFNDDEIADETTLNSVVRKQKQSVEEILTILYRPQAVFRVNAVARCTASLPGHEEAVLSVQFSADGRNLASGSGDTTVRIWDPTTETPKSTLRGHRDWVLAVAWSSCGTKIASAGMDKEIRIWDPETARPLCKAMKGHTKAIVALCWEPMLYNPRPIRLASASQDWTIRIWDSIRGSCLFTLSGHTKPIRALKWGGNGLLYSGGEDRSVRAWSIEDKKLFRLMEGHAHWVNSLSSNTEYALRQGCYDYTGNGRDASEGEKKTKALANYNKILTQSNGVEYLVSGSDDFTLFLWKPQESGKPIARLTGHQQPVNFIQYSPDGNLIASASFDKSIRIWGGFTGKFIMVFRAHVQSVYQVAWSADSRLLVSSSKDSTIKLWDLKKKTMLEDLPGHADEVFAVDWSPDGDRVCSGGKDRVLKIWRA
jgi:ribosome assembly protein 4